MKNLRQGHLMLETQLHFLSGHVQSIGTSLETAHALPCYLRGLSGADTAGGCVEEDTAMHVCMCVCVCVCV